MTIVKVLDYPKFKFTAKEIEQFIEILLSHSIVIEPKEDIDIIKDDPEDNKFLECSIKADADFLISGDHHILKLHQYREIEILSPTEFIEFYASKTSKS